MIAGTSERGFQTRPFHNNRMSCTPMNQAINGSTSSYYNQYQEARIGHWEAVAHQPMSHFSCSSAYHQRNQRIYQQIVPLGCTILEPRCSEDIAGVVIRMIEPRNNKWFSWVYRNLHDEVFDPPFSHGVLNKGDPLSQVNGALPWIIFQRNYQLFNQRPPQLSRV